MGEIVVDVEFQNAIDRAMARKANLEEFRIRRAAVSAVVDTGALMLGLPEDVVARLGIDVLGSETFTFADGRRGELPVAGPLTVHIGDRWTFARGIVTPRDTDASIGQLVMRELDLVADCRNRTLGPGPSHRTGRCSGCEWMLVIGFLLVAGDQGLAGRNRAAVAVVEGQDSLPMERMPRSGR